MIKFSNGVIVNLACVSSVKQEPSKGRLILNMNYAIKKRGNVIPDYVYVNGYTQEDLDAIKKDPGFKDFVIGTSTVWVNRNNIAYVKVGERDVTVNVSVPHSYQIKGEGSTVMANFFTFGFDFLERLGEKL